MKKIKVLAICAIAVLSITSAKAQFSTGADIVSSYVWRGIQQDRSVSGNPTLGSPNIQPYISFTTGGLTIGSWASSSFLGNIKEVDLYATYAFSSSLALTVTDYNWGFSSTKGYFDYTKKGDHMYEGSLAYTGPEAFPIGATVNTFFAGCDTLATGKQAFSTYLELSYPVTNAVKVFAGASLFKSGMVYNTNGFSVTNVGIKASKSINITDKCCFPVYGILGANLSTKSYGGADKPSTLYFVAGITL
ncbi:MAG: hypothetical protein QM800_11560 [Paludibacter sp.]